MARGEFADHLRDFGAIEGAQRDDAVVRAQAPGRAEFRPRSRDDEERRLRAALGESLHQIERGRVGPVQVLERERDGLRARPGQKPRDQRRELPSPQLFGRQIRGAVRRQAGCRRGARAAAHVRQDRARSAATCSRGRRGAGQRGRRAAEALAAPFGDRVQRRILQQLRR